MTHQNNNQGANKVWFITGASRGFGRVWADAALKRGDKVAATARSLESIADLKEKSCIKSANAFKKKYFSNS